MPTQTREKKSSGGKANALKPLQPSEELAAVVARAHSSRPSDNDPSNKAPQILWGNCARLYGFERLANPLTAEPRVSAAE